MMTRSLLFAASLLVTACAGTPEPTRLYLLQSAAPAAAMDPVAEPGLVLGEIGVAGFLNQSGIVYQTSDNRVSVANRHRWASPLDSQLRQSLFRGLAERLDATPVFEQAAGAPVGSQRLDVTVAAFHGRYDGMAIVAGSWQLRQPGGRIEQRGAFRQTVALQTDGYDELVRSLADGWGRSIQEMAAALRGL